MIFAGRPYRHRHGVDSIRRCFDRRVPLSWLAGNRANRPAASGDRPAAEASWSASAFIPRSAAVGVALPDLAASHRCDSIGQAGNRCRMASQRVPAPLALAITPPRATQDRNKIRDLIRRMSRANPLWGAPRIDGELQARHRDQSNHSWALDAVASQDPLPDLAWEDPLGAAEDDLTLC